MGVSEGAGDAKGTNVEGVIEGTGAVEGVSEGAGDAEGADEGDCVGFFVGFLVGFLGDFLVGFFVGFGACWFALRPRSITTSFVFLQGTEMDPSTSPGRLPLDACSIEGTELVSLTETASSTVIWRP